VRYSIVHPVHKEGFPCPVCEAEKELDRLRALNAEMLEIVEAVGKMMRTSEATGELWNAVDWNTDLGDKDPALAAYNAAGEAHTAAWDKMEALHKAWATKAEACSSNVIVGP